MEVMIDKTFNQQCMVADTPVDYGYGDAAPSTTDYGYGDAAPSNARNDANKYGYESADATTDYGYGSSDSNQYGYGDTNGNGETLRRRERPRRRGSVTKYSLDATQEVQKQEHHSHQEGAPGDIIFHPPDGVPVEGTLPLNDGSPLTPSPGIGKMRKSRRKKKPSTTSADDYGYGDATPDSEQNPYGYGDYAPDSSAAAAEKYGYGDASNDASKYGYGDASNDASKYGYGDASNDASKYGYGDDSEYVALNDADKYGYGDTSDANKYGYGDAGSVGAASHSSHHSSGEPRRRPRRRGSVTKYSLEATEQVASEYQEKEPRKNPPLGEFLVTLKDAPDRQNSGPTSSDDEMSCDSGDAMSCQSDDDNANGTDKKKKKKKKRGFGRFRIGRHRSSESHGSKGSKNGDA